MRRRPSALLVPTPMPSAINPAHERHGLSGLRIGRALLAALTLACTLLLPVSASFAHDHNDRGRDRGHHDRGNYGYRDRSYHSEHHHRGWQTPGWGRSHYRPYPPPPPAWRYYHPHHHRWYHRH